MGRTTLKIILKHKHGKENLNIKEEIQMGNGFGVCCIKCHLGLFDHRKWAEALDICKEVESEGPYPVLF